ncbi:PAS domain S-box protein [Sporolactobacillus kofuensis]|uniref:PAS domain S-box protein n=1 Tax=Sporolactobacillus kofuensis TaxID=269672 RepID=A0ABW1WGE3_9BACL|nr:PAS domain S-box protein [Sporolactobacillus kofuensis]MCO7177148.1 PAS domain S-box protein [Sporolactobacillus kofuensis]
MKSMHDQSLVGVAYLKLIFDPEGRPCDCIFLQINAAFKAMLRLENIGAIGKRASEVMPELPDTLFQRLMRQVFDKPLHGEEQTFEFADLWSDHMYKTSVYALEKNRLWINLVDTAYNEPSQVLEKFTGMDRKQPTLGRSAERIEETYHLLFDHVSEAIVIAQDGYIKLSNQYTEKLTKYSRQALTSLPFSQLIAPQDRERMMANHFKQMCGERQGSYVRFRGITADHQLRWVAMKSVMIKWEGRLASLNFLTDITEQVETEEALRVSKENFKLIFDNAAEAIFIVQDHRIQIANPMTRKLTGYTNDELLGTEIINFISLDHRERRIRIFEKRLASSKKRFKGQFRVLKKNGETIWAQATGVLIEWNGRAAVQFFIIDTTEQKKAEEALRASEQKYRLITDFASDVIWVLNYSKNRFTYVSPSVRQLRGISAEKALSTSIEETFSPDSLHLLKKTIDDKMQLFFQHPDESNTFISEVQLYHADGHLIWTEMSISLRYNAEHELEITGVTRNIEERKKTEQNILYLSYHDQLTGLYNRRYYDEELDRLDQSGEFPLTLVLADVNGLKLTNDAFGHHAGDDLLVRISRILKEMGRDGTTIARVGGDEFVLLMPNTDKNEAGQFVRKIQSKILSEDSVHHTILSVSFGWAVRQSKKQSMTHIFTEAENNMYQHKLFEGNSMRSKTIKMITNTLYAKLPSEERHAKRVSQLSVEIGQKLGMDANNLNELKTAGLLHDIGKITIEENLFKKKTLSALEWTRIRLHPEKGYQILKLSNEFMSISQFILCHHERMDGKGYPLGLKGENIPLPSRIISIVEAFDDMVNDKPYRKKMTQAAAINILKENAGTQFDSELVDLFINEVLLEMH